VSLGARLFVPGENGGDVLHVLVIDKPAEFDARVLGSGKKSGFLKSLRPPRAQSFTLV